MTQAGMSNPNTITQIVIAGGGTAGWMTAAALGHLLDARRISITLVESAAIGTVGVGEATIPPIQTFNRMLGIDENDFIKRTKATFKNGIEFVNWGALGERYIHPFGDFGPDIETLSLHHHWLRMKAQGYERDLFDFAIMAKASAKNRFMRPPTRDPKSAYSAIHYAYQFDAGLYAEYLREYAEGKGVVRVEGRIGEVVQNAESGFVETLKLEDGREIDGELFIDCTGFRGLLIEGALETGYEDWRNYLPVDRAVAVPCTSPGDPIPYTRATAHGAGWQWRIPLQHRLGNGHVYCSEFISDEDALSTLMDNLEGEPLADPKWLRFTTGHRKRFWNRNVVALGLAAGFMEPLESTSISLIQTGIARLMTLFPDLRFNPVDAEEYDRRTVWEYERVRDFLVLHYVLTQRDDTPFWRHAQTLPVSDMLARKMELFRTSGRIRREGNEMFTDSSWLAVYTGQGLEPEGWDPLAERFDAEMIRRRLENVADVVDRASESMPDHARYIAEDCLPGAAVAAE